MTARPKEIAATVSLDERLDAVEKEMAELIQMQEDFKSSQINQFYRWVFIALAVGGVIGFILGRTL